RRRRVPRRLPDPRSAVAVAADDRRRLRLGQHRVDALRHPRQRRAGPEDGRLHGGLQHLHRRAPAGRRHHPRRRAQRLLRRPADLRPCPRRRQLPDRRRWQSAGPRRPFRRPSVSFAMRLSLLLSGAAALALSTAPAAAQTAPGAPGDTPTWVNAAKTGAGASYEAYVDGQYRDGGPTGDVSRVWFSIADGVLTETMYGLIHEAQIKQLRFAVVTEDGLSVEGTDTTHRTEYLHTDANGRPLSPAYRVITTDKAGRYEIEKRIFTDPDGQALVVRSTIRALRGEITPYLLLEPHLANTGVGDEGNAIPGGLIPMEGRRDPVRVGSGLYASEGDVHLAIRSREPFTATSVGFVGASVGLADLADGDLVHAYVTSGREPGSIVFSGALPAVRDGRSLSRDFVIGFGPSR